MYCLGNIAMRDYQEIVTTGQTDTLTDGQTDKHPGQSDPYVLLCFTGNTKSRMIIILLETYAQNQFSQLHFNFARV